MDEQIEPFICMSSKHLGQIVAFAKRHFLLQEIDPEPEYPNPRQDRCEACQ